VAIEACFSGTLVTKDRKPQAKRWRDEARELLELASLENLNIDRLAAVIASKPPGAEVLVYLAALAGRHSLTDRQRKAAESKNAHARAWVQAKWDARPELNESKAAFSRRIQPAVVTRFGTSPTPEWIARKWLPREDALSGFGRLRSNDEDGRLVAWTGRPHFKP